MISHSAAPDVLNLPAQQPLAARLLPSNFYYGWAIVFACGALMFVSVGVGYYGLAVYLGPLQELHGWSNSDVSLPTGMYFVFSGITAAWVGPRIDRQGAKRWMLPGLVLIIAAACAVGQVQDLWQLFVAYIVLAIGSGMSAGVAVNATLTRWFVQRRAWAMAMASTGVSLGGVVLSPLNGFLIEQFGLSVATPVMAGLILVIGLPIVLFVLVWDPRQMGLPQDGLRPAVRVATNVARSAANQTRVWTVGKAARTVPFWAIMLSFLIVLLAQTGFILHQTALLEERLGSLTVATTTLSILAFGSIVARLVVGRYFADRVDLRILTVIMFVVQGTAALVVIRFEGAIMTYIAVLTFGFTIGNVYMLLSLLTSDVFGYVSFGAIYGMISMATQMSSGIGPLLIGLLDDITGSYDIPLTLVAILTYAAILPIWFAKPPKADLVKAINPLLSRSAPQRTTEPPGILSS
ncbi:MAG: MFS transporter [Chloroflexi bacterium]|nr:MFS transporter [Chloroflexota bacterium]MYF21285.1 MFS transporter [Chloroflexota bacterium]